VNEAYRRCCGIDIHKDTIVIYVLLPAISCDGQGLRKTYGTFRNDLIRMRVWLKTAQGHRDRNGIDRRILASGLEYSRKRGFSSFAGESRAGKGTRWTKERAAMRGGSRSTCKMGGWMGASFHRPKCGSCE
jgi:hypothetical protein